jgi:hypothetical protein
VNECEKRGLSVIEENHLDQEGICDNLFRKLGRTDFVMQSLANREQKKKEILEAIAKEEGEAADLIDLPVTTAATRRQSQIRQYHIVGLAAKRLDDSKKKWRFNKVVMEGDNLMAS